MEQTTNTIKCPHGCELSEREVKTMWAQYTSSMRKTRSGGRKPKVRPKPDNVEQSVWDNLDPTMQQLLAMGAISSRHARDRATRKLAETSQA